MTYSLRTLTNPSPSPEADSPSVLNEGLGLMRFTQEIVLFLGAAVLILLALAMFSFSPKDPSRTGWWRLQARREVVRSPPAEDV